MLSVIKPMTVDLTAEYGDLEQQLYYCNRREERKRCAKRMNEIIGQLPHAGRGKT